MLMINHKINGFNSLKKKKNTEFVKEVLLQDIMERHNKK